MACLREFHLREDVWWKKREKRKRRRPCAFSLMPLELQKRCWNEDVLITTASRLVCVRVCVCALWCQTARLTPRVWYSDRSPEKYSFV